MISPNTSRRRSANSIENLGGAMLYFFAAVIDTWARKDEKLTHLEFALSAFRARRISSSDFCRTLYATLLPLHATHVYVLFRGCAMKIGATVCRVSGRSLSRASGVDFLAGCGEKFRRALRRS